VKSTELPNATSGKAKAIRANINVRFINPLPPRSRPRKNLGANI
jgi:hypothetical protein